MRSQDLPPAYVVNGSLYLISPGDLVERASFFAPDVVPLVVEVQREALDVDTAWDWAIAEAVVQGPERNGPS